MNLFHIRAPIFGFLILMIRASLAYPLNTSSQSTTLASPTLSSLISPEYLGDDYPVYPIVCIAPRGALPSPSEIPKILSDCSWIINEILLRKYDILFQDLVFRYNDYIDHFGQRHHSFWDHGKCAITVTSGSREQTQKLQLFNVVLAANKILKDCILDQQVAQGGITRIGSLDKLFHVNVQGWPRYGTVNQSNIALLSSLDAQGRVMQRSLLPTTSNAKTSNEHFNTKQLTVSPPKWAW